MLLFPVERCGNVLTDRADPMAAKISICVIVLLIASNFLQAVNLPLGIIGHEESTILVILNSLRLLKNRHPSQS